MRDWSYQGHEQYILDNIGHLPTITKIPNWRIETVWWDWMHCVYHHGIGQVLKEKVRSPSMHGFLGAEIGLRM
jgi:hypothetical protein